MAPLTETMSREQELSTENCRPQCSMPLVVCPMRIQERCCDLRYLGEEVCPLAKDKRTELEWRGFPMLALRWPRGQSPNQAIECDLSPLFFGVDLVL
jgi:hypothetical protein